MHNESENLQQANVGKSSHSALWMALPLSMLWNYSTGRAPRYLGSLDICLDSLASRISTCFDRCSMFHMSSLKYPQAMQAPWVTVSQAPCIHKAWEECWRADPLDFTWQTRGDCLDKYRDGGGIRWDCVCFFDVFLSISASALKVLHFLMIYILTSGPLPQPSWASWRCRGGVVRHHRGMAWIVCFEMGRESDRLIIINHH